MLFTAGFEMRIEGIVGSDRSMIVKVTLIECQTSKEQPQSAPDIQVPTEAEEGSSENGDTIAMAMALLVIENTHLREVIRNLRDTISGLTDHKLL